MASAKRFRNDEEFSVESSETESDCDYGDYGLSSRGRRPRQPKSFSRNALLARENRLKKKLYLENMERELAKERNKNRKIGAMLKEQAGVIEKQEKELKYMRSVLANSSDISKLLRSINTNTGMSVGTSLNRNLSISEDSTGRSPLQQDHPWQEDLTIYSGTLSPLLLDGGDFDFSSALEMPLPSLLDSPTNLDEHNYTASPTPITNDDDVGVCLHVSKHRVSLEFCASCSDNATECWI